MSQNEERQQLLERAQQGDDSALEQLLWDYASELSRYLAPQMPADLKALVSVDDVLQQTLFEAFKGFSSYREQTGGSFTAWLKTIARHRLLDSIRKTRGRDVARGGLPEGTSLSSCPDLVEMVPDTATHASAVARRAEAEHALQLALEHLPQESREILILRYARDLSIDEIAEQTGRTRGSVRGLLDRAKAELRNILGSLSQFISVT